MLEAITSVVQALPPLEAVEPVKVRFSPCLVAMNDV